MSNLHLQTRFWMLRSARHLKVWIWKYLFKDDPRSDVLEALAIYQNPDGGSDRALSPDPGNPASTPTAPYARSALKLIEYDDCDEHQFFQGVLCYLSSGSGRASYGWQFTLPSNDHSPHAPWWNYSE